MGSYGWLLDPKRCIECRACEAACKQWNNVATGVNVRYRLVQIQEEGAYPKVQMQALSLACNHCDTPLCAKACPVKAIWKRDDGVVLINREKCVGCTMCQKFCPYEAPQFNRPAWKMEKCTMCADRIDAGQLPACVVNCPTEALRWGRWENIASIGEGKVDGFDDPALTQPHIRFITTPWGSK